MKPTFEELSDRLTKHRAHAPEAALREVSVAWSGYLSGLLEWGLLSIQDFDRLYEMMPELVGDNEPAAQIMRGFEYE